MEDNVVLVIGFVLLSVDKSDQMEQGNRRKLQLV